MFSSPALTAIRPYTQENTDSLVGRKPGTLSLSTRKPLSDRCVNGKTPDLKRNIKVDLPQCKETTFNEDEDLSCTDYLYSHKEVEDDYNMFSKSEQLHKKEAMITIFVKYLDIRDPKTPPPHVMITDDEKLYEMEEEPETVFTLDPDFLKPVAWDDSFEMPEIDSDDEYDISM